MGSAMKQQGEPIQLGGKRLVFTDYHHIRPASFYWRDQSGKDITVVGTAGLWDAQIETVEAPVGIRIMAQPAERSPEPFPGIKPTKPWEESNIKLGCRTMYDEDDGYFKAWSTCSATGKEYRCYLQSRDFETWERPELGIVEFEGSKKNNLIEADDLGFIFKDPSSKEERWKWIADRSITRQEYEDFQKNRPLDWNPQSDRVDASRDTHVGPGNEIFALRGGISADGFRWKTIPEPLVVEHADTLNMAYYDTRLKKYVAYVRHWLMPDRCPNAPTDDRGLSWMAGRRTIGRSETDDFRRFPVSECIMAPGPNIVGPSDTLYTNNHTFVPFAPDQHLFFPTIWHQMNDSASIGVASSLNGKVLHWLPGSPILTTAPFGQWDGGWLFVMGQLMELPDGRWILPYTGYNVPHKYPRKGAIKSGLGFATWKKGRLIVVEAPERGQFTTYAIMAPGNKLRINALTLRGGSVRVEITRMGEGNQQFLRNRADRQVVPGRSFDDCDPIRGDQYLTPVTWKGIDNIGVEAGTPIRLRIKMDQAKLFFFDFE